MKEPQNIAASIRQRLLTRAKSDGRPFNELLQYYGMERFLYRLSLSPYAQQFILKGALMLRIWNAPEFNQRGTQLPVEVEAFADPFINAKQIQWTAFRKRLQQDHVPVEFNEIVLSVSKFLIPILPTSSNKESAPKTWMVQGHWSVI